MDKIILTDADGVLLDWNTRFDEYMKALGYDRVPDTDDTYSLKDRFALSSQYEAKQIAGEYNRSEILRTLDPYKDAQKYVKLLADHGFRFICVTSVGDSEECKINRTENLLNVFGNIFDDVICLPVGLSKQDTLERHWGGSGYFWIEDHFKNAEAGHEVGLRPLLVDTDYNAHYQTDLFPRVDGEEPWKEITAIIAHHYGMTIV